MELFLLFLLIPALFAYMLQWKIFNNVKHKLWQHGSLALVAPPILFALLAYVLLPNITDELKDLIMVCWVTMSLGVVLGWAAAFFLNKLQQRSGK